MNNLLAPGALDALALLHWHDSGLIGFPYRHAEAVRAMTDDELRTWVSGAHRTLAPCSDGRRCRIKVGDGPVRYLDHPTYDPGAEDVATALTGAQLFVCVDTVTALDASSARLWPWDGADRRSRAGAIDIHVAAVAVARLLAQWWSEEPGTDPSLAWAHARIGLSPTDAAQWRGAGVPRDDVPEWAEVTRTPAKALRAIAGGKTPEGIRGEPPTQQPPYLGLGVPLGPWMRHRDGLAKVARESMRTRVSCGVCWRYGVDTPHGDRCASCRRLEWAPPPDATSGEFACHRAFLRLARVPAAQAVRP